MKEAGSTYHYSGSLNARRPLATRNNPVWRATAGGYFQTIFWCMRQHGHFGLAEQD
jgi:hypothetical protein